MTREEQALFNLAIKKKSGLSINLDIHHSKVPSSDDIRINLWYNGDDIMILCNVLWTIYTRHLGLHNHIPNKVSKHVDQMGYSKEWGGGLFGQNCLLSVFKF